MKARFLMIFNLVMAACLSSAQGIDINQQFAQDANTFFLQYEGKGQQGQDSYASSRFLSYVSGWIEGLAVTNKVDFPLNMSYYQLSVIVAQYYHENPEIWGLPRGSNILTALVIKLGRSPFIEVTKKIQERTK